MPPPPYGISKPAWRGGYPSSGDMSLIRHLRSSLWLAVIAPAWALAQAQMQEPQFTSESPKADTLITAPASITVSADIAAHGHRIDKVAFYDGATLLGEFSNPPYEMVLSNVPPGSKSFWTRMVYDHEQRLDSAKRPVFILNNEKVSIGLDPGEGRHPINPLIYGVNNAKGATISELNFTINRRGGEVESRYNWSNNAHNLCFDWFFISTAGGGKPGADADATVRETMSAKADMIIQVPTIGWMPKADTWSYSIKKYGPQMVHEPYGRPDAGNGILPAGGAKITNNDPNDANFLPTDPITYQGAYIDHLLATWGTSTTGGVKYYSLDNEPKLWSSTHRDIRGNNKPTKEEIRDYIISYGGMIKEKDPSAQILAAEEWGWYDWKNYYPWLLQQMSSHDARAGKRILDILTLHYYAAVPGPQGSLAKLFALNRSTRSLWDPTYKDEGISGSKPVINLIPTMKEWVRENYPGTGIGITEYNWGFEKEIAGAVIEAEVLGIFGREGLDLATRWGSAANHPANIVFKAMKLFRNYDDHGSSFGDVSIKTSCSANPDELSVFAAERSSDKALTLMVINKQPLGTRPVEINLSQARVSETAEAWQLDASNAIRRLPDLPFASARLTTSVSPQSITLYLFCRHP